MATVIALALVAILAVNSVATTAFAMLSESGTAACCDAERQSGVEPVPQCEILACPCLACLTAILEGAMPSIRDAHLVAAVRKELPPQGCLPGVSRLIERPPKFC